MSHRVDERRSWDVASKIIELASDERAWLATAIGTGLLVYFTYLVTHPYPAYGAGLYIQIAQEISAHGYALPEQIPGYTENGIPFGYPPLMYYVSAVLLDLTGVDPITFSRLLPGFVVVLTLVPYYYLSHELLKSTPRAGFSTLLLAVTPAVLQWHLSAGGIVRAPAFLFTVTGAYTGLKLFSTGDRRWLIPSAMLFGLTVLTHPTYTVFFVVTYLLLYVCFDRSPMGLLHGAVVAGGGLLLASPWLSKVILIHGVDIFTAASGTHSGLGGGVERLLGQLLGPVELNVTALFYLGSFAGGVYLLAKRRLFLPLWLVTAAFVIAKVRFQFPAGAMMTSVFVFEVFVPRVRAWFARTNYSRSVPLIAIVVLGIVASGVGVAFAGSSLDEGQRTTQPAFMNSHDAAAMEWTVENTDPSARFVVLGDAAEWFPLKTDRTITVGPWGVEWVSSDAYRHQLHLYKRLSHCPGRACLTSVMMANDVNPDYVYVPKGHYTVRGFDEHQKPWMRTQLVSSDRYRLVYENEGAMIFRVDKDMERISVPDDGPQPEQ